MLGEYKNRCPQGGNLQVRIYKFYQSRLTKIAKSYRLVVRYCTPSRIFHWLWWPIVIYHSHMICSKHMGHLDKWTPDIGIMVRVFANGPGDLGSIPGRVIPKTQKMVLDPTLFNTQQYKVRIKGKVEQSRERSSALPYTSV